MIYEPLTKEKLMKLLEGLLNAAYYYGAAGYRTRELWEAFKHIFNTMDDVVEELSIPE